MWIPAYMRHMFWAGMRTTQRSESINSFFDGYVNRNTSLREFAGQYFAAVQARARAEEDEDASSRRNTYELVSTYSYEADFQKVYTNHKFREFQIECLKLMYVNQLECKKVNEQIYEHIIRDRIWYRCKATRKDVPSNRHREYKVTFNSVTNDAWCECKKFECHGIMCRHLVLVFDTHNVKKLHMKFFVRRWYKELDREHVKIGLVHLDPLKSDAVKRFERGMIEFEPLCQLAAELGEEEMESLVGIIKVTLESLKSKGSKTDGVENRRDCGNEPGLASKKRTRVNDIPDLNETDFAEFMDDVTGHGNCAEAGCAREFVVKDPPLPKKPKHRPTESRYKSVDEVKTIGKGKGNGKKKGKATNEAVSDESIPNSVVILIEQCELDYLYLFDKHFVFTGSKQADLGDVLAVQGTYGVYMWTTCMWY